MSNKSPLGILLIALSLHTDACTFKVYFNNLESETSMHISEYPSKTSLAYNSPLKTLYVATCTTDLLFWCCSLYIGTAALKQAFCQYCHDSRTQGHNSWCGTLMKALILILLLNLTLLYLDNCKGMVHSYEKHTKLKTMLLSMIVWMDWRHILRHLLVCLDVTSGIAKVLLMLSYSHNRICCGLVALSDIWLSKDFKHSNFLQEVIYCYRCCW